MFLKFILISVSLFFIACQPQKDTDKPASPPPKVYFENSLYIKQNIKFRSCDLETPCPSGLDCAYLELNTGNQAACIDSSTVCEHLGCSRGVCVAAQSYPLQIRCAQ